MSTPAQGAARPHAAAELAVDVDAAAVADPTDLRDDAEARTELPLEADPADVAEQDADVPYDAYDEER